MRKAIIILISLMALALAGCGGASSTTTHSVSKPVTPPVTKPVTTPHPATNVIDAAGHPATVTVMLGRISAIDGTLVTMRGQVSTGNNGNNPLAGPIVTRKVQFWSAALGDMQTGDIVYVEAGPDGGFKQNSTAFVRDIQTVCSSDVQQGSVDQLARDTDSLVSLYKDTQHSSLVRPDLVSAVAALNAPSPGYPHCSVVPAALTAVL